MNHEEQLADEIISYGTDPLGFVRFCYPWGEDGELYDEHGPRQFQKNVLNQISTHLRGPNRFEPLQLSIASGHGIGKSTLIAWIDHWAMSTCEDCRVVVTAGTGKQLQTKTWPEITKWFQMGINSHWWDIKAESISIKQKDHQKRWRTDAITWSEHNTDPFAGTHNKGKRIVIIFDESSSIADKIWEVTEGALTDEKTEIIWLAFGNPTQTTGRFRECFGSFRHRWNPIQIDSRDVPGTNKKLFQQWVEDHGEDSDFVRVRVRGEFPRASANQFIGSDIVQAARERNLPESAYMGEFKILSADIARFGDNKTVFGIRQGPRMKILDKLRGLDTVQVAERLIERIKQEKPRAVVIDGDGIGAGVIDQLHVRSRRSGLFHAPDDFDGVCTMVFDFHGGGTPLDPTMYFNRRAEVWGMLRDWLKKEADIPNDAEVASELTGPQYYFSNKGQIQLERKDEMILRGVESPDIADMMAMSFATQAASQTKEEKDHAQIVQQDDPMQKVLLQFKLSLEHNSGLRKAEERRPMHWD